MAGERVQVHLVAHSGVLIPDTFKAFASATRHIESESFMFRSLRGRLIVLLALLTAAAIAAGALMIGLFGQSATAQAGQDEAEIGRACDAIGAAYRFYSAGWRGAADAADNGALRRDLTAVVQTALRDRPGVEGGIWQSDAGSLAYAFPTYQGAGPKTDVPEAELPRIRAVNRAALTGDRLANSSYDASSQILLVTACPLPGSIPSLTAWTMTRVHTFAGSGYRLLMACAVRRRRFPVGASPTRRTLEQEATGAVMEVTKWLKPSV